MSTETTAPTSPPAKKSSVLFKILMVVAASVAAFAGFIVTQPDDFRVERSTVIAASPDAVFAQVNDFHKWDNWSPWAKLDPNAKNTFAGPDSGEGAKFSWVGNNDVGTGGMTITEAVPHERISIRLDFEKPMKDTSTAEFTFQPQGNQTKVTWAMFGKYQNFVGKAMCTVMNMDKMIGGKFEEGLASLKTAAEKSEASTSDAAPSDRN